ncbi:VanW family protein [Oceanobacillus manasiensis]|uniref:VanW family protein n=1 Tax=Oceanobacillus manasiensis TaxID=586413 RepID=UPI000693898A|nr:VanW family protein [Oceanobacillus manasiensis]
MRIFFILVFLLSLMATNVFASSNVRLDKIEIRQYGLFPAKDSPFIDEGRMQILMRDLQEKVSLLPKNAYWSADNELIAEKPGRTLDRETFEVLFRSAYYDGNIEYINVPTIPVYPRVDRSLLEEIQAKELGSYITYYKKNNKERSENIALAASAIDSSVIFPGESFSFNNIVGERTAERGYKRAPVIVKGELAEDIGGGICQVSSTLFNAVDLKGIQIVERYAHSRRVPYVPEGRDATVSWWGPDFVFKNKYNQPLLIRAHANNGRMVVRILSSDSVGPFTGES